MERRRRHHRQQIGQERQFLLTSCVESEAGILVQQRTIRHRRSMAHLLQLTRTGVLEAVDIIYQQAEVRCRTTERRSCQWEYRRFHRWEHRRFHRWEHRRLRRCRLKRQQLRLRLMESR